MAWLTVPVAAVALLTASRILGLRLQGDRRVWLALFGDRPAKDVLP